MSPVLHVCWWHDKYNIQWNYFLFLILQQNIDTIKVENDVNIEEDFVSMKTVEIYIPSAFAVKTSEPVVSIVFMFSGGKVKAKLSLCVTN
jgi:hypothetical protein